MFPAGVGIVNVQSFADSFCLALERSHHPAQYASSVILSEALVLSEAKELSAFPGVRLSKRRDSFLRQTLRKTQGVLRTGATLGMTMLVWLVPSFCQRMTEHIQG